jgi:hypothetical protein
VNLTFTMWPETRLNGRRSDLLRPPGDGVCGGTSSMKTLPEPRPSPPPTAPSPRYRRPGLTARDAARVAAAIEAEIAPSTRTVYASAWHKWEEWCNARGITAMPSHTDALAAYLAERAEEGLTYASIDVACCAVSYRHRQHGLTDPTLRRVRR